MLGIDIWKGTNVDDVLVTTVAILTLIGSLAALGHKPPLRQIGKAIGWVFGRLIGEPVAKYLAAWYGHQLVDQLAPILDAKLEPIDTKLEHLHGCVERVAEQATERTEALNDRLDTVATDLAERDAELDRRLDELASKEHHDES